MEYKVLLIFVVGLVMRARCNPYKEDRMIDEILPANIERGQQCVEDDQVCQGLVRMKREYGADSWWNFQIYCFNYGPQSGSPWPGTPNKTWGKLCPVTCNMCPRTTTNPEPCSDRHPGCAQMVEWYSATFSTYGRAQR